MKKFLENWKKLAIIFANFQIKLLLYIIYFLIILPYSMGFSIKSLFTKKPFKKSSSWVGLDEQRETIDSLRRQY